jgi:hypothetical protein
MKIYIFLDCILTELGILYIDVVLCDCLMKANREYHVIIAGALRIVFLVYWRIFLSSYRTNLYKIICNFFCTAGSQLKQKNFNRVYERLSRVNHVKVVDSMGVSREVLARYIKEYPVENNDWGDYQTHRRLLGLISIGKLWCSGESCYNT